MIDVHRLAGFAPGSPMRTILDHVAAGRAAQPPRISAAPPVRHDHTPDLIAAVLTAGMIAASGREHTAAEAVGVWREVKAAMGSPEGVCGNK